MTVLLKASLVVNMWTKYTVIAIPGSLAIWYAFLPLYAYVAPMLGVSEEFIGINSRIWENVTFWLMAVVLPVLCNLRDIAWK